MDTKEQQRKRQGKIDKMAISHDMHVLGIGKHHAHSTRLAARTGAFICWVAVYESSWPLEGCTRRWQKNKNKKGAADCCLNDEPASAGGSRDVL